MAAFGDGTEGSFCEPGALSPGGLGGFFKTSQEVRINITKAI
ncbi:MAG: hypothetical protein WAU24_14485 [Chitinophagaceae bacterium]